MNRKPLSLDVTSHMSQVSTTESAFAAGKDGTDREEDDRDKKDGRGSRDRDNVDAQEKSRVGRFQRQCGCAGKKENAKGRCFGNEEADQFTAAIV